MLKFLRNILILMVFASIWLFTDLDYDAKNQDSIQKMLTWSPFSAEQCLDDMRIAGDNMMMSNLHGLNCKQIRDVALTKAEIHLAKEKDTLSKALEKSQQFNAPKVKLYLANIIDSEATIHNQNYQGSKVIVVDSSKIEDGLRFSEARYEEVTAELNDMFRKMPWVSKKTLNDINFVPVGFDLLDANNKKITAAVELMGDRLDTNKDENPNTAEDAANKRAGKTWQDENGFMHYSDGSISNSPVDSE